MVYLLRILLVFACLHAGSALARLPEAKPHIAVFQSTVDAFPQNFAIESDDSGNVYLGNSEGVLVYDGHEWRLVPTSNGDHVRSLDDDGAGRIYVGGFDAFGYIERDSFGRFVYTDLTRLFAEDLAGELFADIWKTLVTQHGVFFVGLEHVFLYKPGSDARAGFWKHEKSLGPIAEWNGRVWMQWRHVGLKSFDGSRWVLHPEESLERDFLAELVPRDDALIVVNTEGDWFRYSDSGFSVMPLARNLPLGGSVTSAFSVGEKLIGLTTNLGKLVFFEPDSGSAEVVTVTGGFISEATVTRSGSVLVVDGEGFRALDWPARWRSIGPDAGLAGNIHDMHVTDRGMHVLTSSGAFVADVSKDRFRRLSWTEHEAWYMLPRESGETLFADSYAIKVIDPAGHLRTIDDNTTARLLVPSVYRDDIVYAGTEFGLQVLHRATDGWRVVLTLDDMTNLTVTHIVETGPGELLLGSARGGVYAVVLNELDWTVTRTQMTAEKGLHYGNMGAGAYVYRMGEDIIASTGAGLFRFTGEGFEKYSLDGADALPRGDEALALAIAGGERWAFSYRELFRYDRQAKRWLKEDISLISRGAINTVAGAGQHVLVGNLGTVLIFDPAQEEPVRQSNTLKLNKVLVDTNGNDERGLLPMQSIRVSTGQGRLTFSYALPEFRNPSTVRYRTRLLPVESHFSAWTGFGEESFVDLQAGGYELRVEAEGSSGERTTLSIPFSVEPQWFETTAVRGVSLLAVLLLLFTVLRYIAGRQARMLEQENERLEAKVAERTRELESANQQLERMAHIDGLTQIPNRRRLDNYLEDVFSQSRERDRELAVALIDVDHFKQFNDTRGHQAGDALLVELAKLLSRRLRRAEDLVARYGGEEFLVVLPGADTDTAHRVIEDLRSAVEGSQLGITVSAGIFSAVPNGSTTVESMIEQADRALYRAKEAGRNRVVVSGS